MQRRGAVGLHLHQQRHPAADEVQELGEGEDVRVLALVAQAREAGGRVVGAVPPLEPPNAPAVDARVCGRIPGHVDEIRVEPRRDRDVGRRRHDVQHLAQLVGRAAGRVRVLARDDVDEQRLALVAVDAGGHRERNRQRALRVRGLG